MNTSDECPHGDYRLSCPPCQRPEGQLATRQPADPAPYGATTVAKYDGYCRICRDTVHTGQRITLRDAGWTHEDCTD